jgi:hypothetical protein
MTQDADRHAVEQTFVAMRALAVGTGGLVARLEEASDALLSLESKELPAALQDEFTALLGTLLATEDISQIAETDAAALALRMLLFHEKVLLSGRVK